MPEATGMSVGWVIVLVFVGAVAEAGLVWWLCERSHRAHAEFLQGRLNAADATIVTLVDRIQAPQTHDLIARQKVQADLADQAKLDPKERERVRREMAVEAFLEKEEWRNHPSFDGAENVTFDKAAGKIVIVWPQDPETGLPHIEELSRFEFGEMLVAPFRS